MQNETKQKIIEMIEMSDCVDPITIIVLMSNGARLQGVASGYKELGVTERVDLVAYLMNKLEIKLEDIEQTAHLSDENRYMLSQVVRGRIY